jgi:predicted acetyltransferase
MLRTISDNGDPLADLERMTKEQASVLGNLFQLYAYDFSQFVPLELAADGRFHVSIDDRWWTDDGHFPFLIRSRGQLSGFALVRRGSHIAVADGTKKASNGDVMDVAEFFVVRSARRRGIGIGAAHALFTAFPGSWEIRVRVTNAAAYAFWARVVEGWTGRPARSRAFSAQGGAWRVFRLNTSRRAESTTRASRPRG